MVCTQFVVRTEGKVKQLCLKAEPRQSPVTHYGMEAQFGSIHATVRQGFSCLSD